MIVEKPLEYLGFFWWSGRGTRCMGRRIFDPMNYLDFEEPIKTLREQT